MPLVIQTSLPGTLRTCNSLSLCLSVTRYIHVHCRASQRGAEREGKMPRPKLKSLTPLRAVLLTPHSMHGTLGGGAFGAGGGCDPPALSVSSTCNRFSPTPQSFQGSLEELSGVLWEVPSPIGKLSWPTLQSTACIPACNTLVGVGRSVHFPLLHPFPHSVVYFE